MLGTLYPTCYCTLRLFFCDYKQGHVGLDLLRPWPKAIYIYKKIIIQVRTLHILFPNHNVNNVDTIHCIKKKCWHYSNWSLSRTSQEAGALRIRQIKTNPTHKSHQNPPPPSPTPFLLINEVYISAMANAESGTTILCDDKRGKNIFRTWVGFSSHPQPDQPCDIAPLHLFLCSELPDPHVH